MSSSTLPFYKYDYSLYTPENIFFLNYNYVPKVIVNSLYLNYNYKYLNTLSFVSSVQEENEEKDYSLFPLALRYVSPDNNTYVIERPPFEIEIDYSTSKSYRARNTPKYLQSTKMWVPWTVSVITVGQSTSFSGSYSFFIYFNDGPLQSLEDKLVPCYLPNSSSGNICMGSDSLGATQLIRDNSSITEVYNHLFNSYFAGWNSDLLTRIYNPEYFKPIIDRICSLDSNNSATVSKKKAGYTSNFGNTWNTSKYFKSMLYVLSQTSLQEHLGYITYTKANNTHYPNLLRHLGSQNNQNSYSLYNSSVEPYFRIANSIAAFHSENNYFENNFTVCIQNYDREYVSQYVSNPYIVSSIYKKVRDSNAQENSLSFNHEEISHYFSSPINGTV